MVRLVNITVPALRSEEVLACLHGLHEAGLTHHLIHFTSQSLTHISLKTKDKHLQKVLKDLQSQTGVGLEFGTIDVLLLQLTKPALGHGNFAPGALDKTEFSDQKSKAKQRQYRIDERMTMDEISAFVDDGNHLTFNYMALLAMASVMAGCGLLGDSAVSVVASMLVSPLMGPILSITFGLAVADYSHVRRGIRNEIVGICISFTTGFLMGLVSAFFYSPEHRSSEITSRGQASGLISGFVVAVATGVAIILAISAGGVNVIVGSAISVSLLPPIVCSGICLAMALIYRYVNEDHENAAHYAVFAGVSMSLFAVNFLSVIVTGFCTFRYIKKVHPEDYQILIKGQLPPGGRSDSISSDMSSYKGSVNGDLSVRKPALQMTSQQQPPVDTKEGYSSSSSSPMAFNSSTSTVSPLYEEDLEVH